MKFRRLSAERREIVQAILSVLIAVVSGVDMIGQQARLVHVLGLTAGALGTGIAIGRLVERRKKAGG